MCFRAIDWAIRQPLKDAKEKLLLVVLANYANGKTGKCYPSRDTLMTMACIANKATLTAKLTALVEKGLIEIVHGVGKNNQYQLSVDFGAEVGSAVNPLPGSVVNQVQDCTRFSSVPTTRFSSEPTPGSVLNHEPVKNQELNQDIRTASVSPSIPQAESSTKFGTSAEIGTGTKNGHEPVPNLDKNQYQNWDTNQSRTSQEPDIPTLSVSDPSQEEEKPAKKTRSVSVPKPEEVTQESWDAWMQVRKNKKASTLNSVAWARFKNEAQKAGLTLQQAVTICAAKEWRGFEAEWLKGSNFGTTAQVPARRIQQQEVYIRDDFF